MSNATLGLNRDQLAKALGGNYAVIRAFEQLVLNDSQTPTTIEEAAAIANTAFAAATQALDLLNSVLASLEPLESAPVFVETERYDPYVPTTVVPIVGTIAEQDASAVAITGGAVDGVVIGATQAADGTFVKLKATGAFGCNNATPQGKYALGADATDLATAITLVNKIKAALIANGIAS